MTSVRSLWLIVPAAMMTSVAMFMIAGLVNIRWDRHRERMESVLQDAMVWRSDVQQKREDAEQAHTRRHLEQIEDERIEALREELTWNVGPARCTSTPRANAIRPPSRSALERVARRDRRPLRLAGRAGRPDRR
jgi:hypothetical protein